MSLTNTHFGAEKLEGLLRDCRRLFFIGIGGVSMYALALLTLAEGVAVSGSDRVESERLELLRRAGAEVFPGHGADVCRAVTRSSTRLPSPRKIPNTARHSAGDCR